MLNTVKDTLSRSAAMSIKQSQAFFQGATCRTKKLFIKIEQKLRSGCR